MNDNLAELIGFIIGDGFLDNYQKHYRIGFVGDPIKDKEYFEYIQGLIKKVWNKQPRIFLHKRGIYMIVNSKDAFLELTQKYGLPIGEGKCEKVTIPKEILNNWNLAKHTIRGIVDTDGTVFVSNKPRSPNYPSIEISTCSLKLAQQLKGILSDKDFKVANIRRYQSKKKNRRPEFKVALYGRENVRKWLNKIGFSNTIKRKKAENAVNYWTTSNLPNLPVPSCFSPLNSET